MPILAAGSSIRVCRMIGFIRGRSSLMPKEATRRYPCHRTRKDTGSGLGSASRGRTGRQGNAEDRMSVRPLLDNFCGGESAYSAGLFSTTIRQSQAHAEHQKAEPRKMRQQLLHHLIPFARQCRGASRTCRSEGSMGRPRSVGTRIARLMTGMGRAYFAWCPAKERVQGPMAAERHNETFLAAPVKGPRTPITWRCDGIGDSPGMH
jgi:hypothetical protein